MPASTKDLVSHMPKGWTGILVLTILIAVLGIPILVAGLTAHSNSVANYERQLDACERGQPYRVVQYTNTLSAIQSTSYTGDAASEGGFWITKAILLTTPGIDPNTGAVNCKQVVEKP